MQIDVLEASVKEKVQKQNPKKDNELLPSEFVQEDPSKNIIPPTDSCIDTSVLSKRFAVKQSIECAHSQGNGSPLEDVNEDTLVERVKSNYLQSLYSSHYLHMYFSENN